MGAAAAAAGIGAAASIGGSLISKSGGGSTQQQQVNTGPWKPQQGYSADGLKSAESIQNERWAQGPYQGNFYAQAPGYTPGVNNQALTYSVNAAPGAANTYNTANTLQQGAPNYVNAANEMFRAGGSYQNPWLSKVLTDYAGGNMPTSSTNGQLSGALNSAAISGANSLGNFAGGQNQAMQQAFQDPTQQLASDAGQYMNSAPIQQAMSANNALVDQTLNEQTNPGLNRAASMGGSLNSSRAGMAEAQANEGATLAKNQFNSSIMNNAFNSGLSTAAQQHTAGLNTALNAANSGLTGNAAIAQGQQQSQLGQSEFDTQARLNATNMGLTSDQARDSLNAQTRLSANSQLGNAVQMGIAGTSAAGQQAAQNFALGSAAGSSQQQADQAALNNQYAQWQMGNQYNQNVLNDYWKIASTPLGTSGNTTAGQQIQNPQNPVGAGLGGAAAGAGLAQNGAFDGLFRSVGDGSGAWFGNTTGDLSGYNFTGA